jgi:hypothetical protein
LKANLNKENLITVTVNKATVKTEGSMSFYITDERTCNIYCQLEYEASSNSLIKNHMEVDNAEDFEITMRIIKPNNEPKKELKFELLDQPSAMFYVSLTDEYKDLIGPYKCELFVDCYINGLRERITTSSFSYKVNASIMNNLDNIIIKDPDYPLVDEILKQLETVDLNNYATKKYVEDAIANIDTNDIDLTAYATNESVDKKIAAIELIPGPQGPQGEVGPQGPAGEAGYTPIKGIDYLTDSEIASIREGLATEEYVDNIAHVIDKSGDPEGIVYEDFSQLRGMYKITGQIKFNNHTISFDNDLVYVVKSPVPILKTIHIWRCAAIAGKYNTTGSDYIYIDYKNNTCEHDNYAYESYVNEKIAAIDISGIDLSEYATKEYVDNIITVIDKLEIGFDDFPEGKGVYRLEGSLKVKDINGNSLTYTGDCGYELVKVYKTSDALYVYTMDNKYFELNITKGTAQKSTYEVSKEYVREQIASISLTSYATKTYVDDAIDKIELTPGPQGPQGEQGIPGEKGDPGEPGPAPDLTAYATKEELNTALGDIESLLKEI